MSTDFRFRALCADLAKALAEYDAADPYHDHKDLLARVGAALARPEVPYDLDRKLLHPAYEPGDGTADGAQLVNMAWFHPVMGCDSLQIVLDNARAIFARWGQPTLAQPEVGAKSLPPDHIDPEHTGADRRLLETFYRACHAEGGTADEIYLRGLRAVLVDVAPAQPTPSAPTDEQLYQIADEFSGEPVAAMRRALELWGQRPAPEPIPVSERLPGEGDCAPWPGEPDADPWCWAGRDIDGGWEWTQLAISHFSSDLGRVRPGQGDTHWGYTHWAPHWAFSLPSTPAAGEVQP